jgi:hypothetical protein
MSQKEFFVRDPFGIFIIFTERINEADASSEKGG